MPRTPDHDPASDELVESVAASFHTLIRSWHYDLEAARAAGAEGQGAVALDPMPVPTAGGSTVDLANTWWEDLPPDWQQELRGMASAAAARVVRAVEDGATAADLDADAAFAEAVAADLARPWLDRIPRVITGGRVEPGPAAAPRVLARTAIHVYAGRAAGIRGLGGVPQFPPPDFSDREAFVRAGGHGPRDEAYASFRVHGERLDPDRLTELTGLRPVQRARRGDLRMNRRTGDLYAPFRTGLWSIGSDDTIARSAPLEEHIAWLLERLEPGRAALRAHMDALGLEADFFCFYWQEQWNSSWRLSAGTLRGIAALGAALGLDSYTEIGDADATSASDPPRT